MQCVMMCVIFDYNLVMVLNQDRPKHLHKCYQFYGYSIKSMYMNGSILVLTNSTYFMLYNIYAQFYGICPYKLYLVLY